jgi:hypothetical protein
MDIFPTYESTSSIQLPSEATVSAAVSSTVSSAAFSSAVSSAKNKSQIKSKFLQNKDLKDFSTHSSQYLILCGCLRALEALGQGLINKDQFGTYFEENKILCRGVKNEVRALDLPLLLAQVFQSTLEQLVPSSVAAGAAAGTSAGPSGQSRPFVICLPTPMSLQAKGRVLEAIASASIASHTAVHVRSILRSLCLSPLLSPLSLLLIVSQLSICDHNFFPEVALLLASSLCWVPLRVACQSSEHHSTARTILSPSPIQRRLRRQRPF